MVFVRLLLLLHPRAFRRRYGRELCAGFAAMRQEPRYRGLRGWIVFYLDVLRDVVPAATRQRCSHFPSLRSGRTPMPDPHPKRNQMETVPAGRPSGATLFPGQARLRARGHPLLCPGDRRQHRDLRHCRWLHLQSVFVPAARSPGQRRGIVSEAVVGHDVYRGAVDDRVPRYQEEQELRADCRVRSREPEHLWRGRAGTRIHGAAARRSVPGHEDEAGARPRIQ